MKKDKIYQQLRKSIPGYSEYTHIPVKDNSDPLVPIPTSAALYANQIGDDMRAYTGNDIFARKDVVRRLAQASYLLATQNKDMRLEVVYGYRALAVQRALFKRQVRRLAHRYSGTALLAAAHNYIAVPEVAGHPAGAAIDVQIVKQNKPLDFGTTIWEFCPDSCTFSPYISRKAYANRQLLRNVMLAVGFAPFDGEWWHFSYGDKEWAYYYNKQHALYDQIDADSLPYGQ